MQLANRLKREIKKNPAKAMGLGALLLVACYFWAPLIAGFLGSGSPAPPPPAQNAAATTNSSPSVSEPVAKPTISAAAYDWQRHSKSIDDSELMRASAKLPNDRDPFHDLAAATAAVQPVENPEPAAPPVTPADAGLVLGSTLVSAHRKIAEINGKSYGINEHVEVATDTLEVSFKIVEIHPRRVVLERDGVRYDLKIPRPLLDGIVEMTGSGDSSKDDSKSTSEPAAGSPAH
jgi:hypothetical protein